MAPSSSPLSTPPPSQYSRNPSSSNPNAAEEPRYQLAAPLPFELAQHVLIYFEESLYMQAFNLLNSLLTSDASSLNPNSSATVPSPAFLSLATTLSVHPRLTTRTLSRDIHEQANAALHLLRLTQKVVGPLNANFAAAFEFTHYDQKRRVKQREALDSSQGDFDPEQRIDSPYADTESLFFLTEDFWHLVGWAFNCACLSSDPIYHARWTRYSLLLDFILDVLESDWELRFHSNSASVEDSLILSFIDSATSGYGRDRRILRAIFADGSSKSLNEFRPIFKHELKSPKRESEKLKKRVVDRLDIDAEVYGDYMAADDSDNSDEDYSLGNSGIKASSTRIRTPSARRITPRNSNPDLRGDADPSSASTSTTTLLGPPQALTQRLRLMHLLSHVSCHPDTISSFLEIPELYTLFVEFSKPLPLPLFASFLTTTARIFSADAYCTFAEMLFERSLEVSNINDNTEGFLTVTKLTTCYAPYGASKGSSVAENCKVSFVLEGTVRSMRRTGALRLEGEQAMELREAVRKGVKRREEVLRTERKRAGEDELAAKMLRESGRRLLRAVGADELEVANEGENRAKQEKPAQAKASKEEDFVAKYIRGENLDEEDSDTIVVMPR